MLAAIGVADLEELVDQSIPRGIRLDGRLSLPPPLTEAAALAHLRELASKNRPRRAMIGLGYYGTITPSVIRRLPPRDCAHHGAQP